MKPPSAPLGLFEGCGVELEYMLVDADTFSVRPEADLLLHDAAGACLSEVELGDISWSNELALHVIELKTTGPAGSPAPLAERFQEHVVRINRLLAARNSRLMPTAMHPTMDPHREMRLWPHEHNAVYEAFDRIFDCRGHGWANLQSVHLNLPFANDEQFGRLHAAVRLLLPLLPALAASSPLVDGRASGYCDTRLHVYRDNAARVPAVSGRVIPEPVFSQAAYDREILQPLYRDIAPHDPQGILRHEWLNARGAIARFDRNTIEIRVLDVQECPAADLAICGLIVDVLRALVEQRWSDTAAQQGSDQPTLVRLLDATIRDADLAGIDDVAYLRALGIADAESLTAAEVWRRLVQRLSAEIGSPEPYWLKPIDRILTRGPLARRMPAVLGPEPSPEALAALCRSLCDCLDAGKML